MLHHHIALSSEDVLKDKMEKGDTLPAQAENGTSVDMDKEVALPQTEDKKSVDMTTTSLDDQPKKPEKGSEDEKGDDEYPQGLKLFFIMLGLCLAVFLIAIGRSAFYPLQWKRISKTDISQQQTKPSS